MVTQLSSQSLSPLQADEFIPPISHWLKFSGLFIIGAASLIGSFSAIAKYKITIQGQAIVRPEGELQIVQAATEGTILKIEVKENQPVRKGDVIATIDDSQLQTKKRQLQHNIQQAHLQVLQVNAQIRAIDNQMLAESDRKNRAVASSAAELSRRRREYHDQQVTAIAQVEEAQAKLRSAEAALNTAHLKWERYKSIAAEGAIAKDKLDEAELDTQQQLEAVAIAQSELRYAQTSLNPIDSQVTIANEQIAQEQASGEAAIAALTKEREALIQQRVQVQSQVAQDTQGLKQVELDLTKTTIRATSNGIISKLNLRNPEQTVASGQEIAQLVPSDAKLVIKTLVTAQDIEKIKIGQKTQLRVSACPYTDYGTLHGTVKTISPDSIVPQNSNSTSASDSPTNYPNGAMTTPMYSVAIEPNEFLLRQKGQQGDKQCHIQLGMEGRVDIISREETVLQTFLRKARLIANL